MSDQDADLPPCQSCGERVPTVFVSFTLIRVMIWSRTEEYFDRLACRVCLDLAFERMTREMLVYGWWGPTSVFLTPVYTVKNFIEYRKARRKFNRIYADPSAKIRPA